jgi:hypothetical protein
MAIHHKTKERYLKLKDSGLTAEDLKEQMLTDEIDPADIDQFITEVYSDEQGDSPVMPPQAPKAQKADKAPKAVETANSIYEEWKMALSHETGSPVLEKVKKIKDVKITHDRAKRLNEQATNRKVQYFLKQN